MKYTFFVFFTAISINVYAQECIYDKNKTDEFTKKRVIELKNQRIFSKMAASTEFIDASLSRNGDYKYLFLIVKTTYSMSCFNEGDKMYLKLKNDSIYTLNNISLECGDYSSNVYYYILGFTLSEEDIEVLKTSPVVRLRLKTIEGDIKEKNQNYFINNLKCLE